MGKVFLVYPLVANSDFIRGKINTSSNKKNGFTNTWAHLDFKKNLEGGADY